MKLFLINYFILINYLINYFNLTYTKSPLNKSSNILVVINNFYLPKMVDKNERSFLY